VERLKAALPVANFDAYFGGKTFSKKYLKAIPPEILERTHTGYGVSRYRVKREYLSCYLL